MLAVGLQQRFGSVGDCLGQPEKGLVLPAPVQGVHHDNHDARLQLQHLRWEMGVMVWCQEAVVLRVRGQTMWALRLQWGIEALAVLVGRQQDSVLLFEARQGLHNHSRAVAIWLRHVGCLGGLGPEEERLVLFEDGGCLWRIRLLQFQQAMVQEEEALLLLQDWPGLHYDHPPLLLRLQQKFLQMGAELAFGQEGILLQDHGQGLQCLWLQRGRGHMEDSLAEREEEVVLWQHRLGLRGYNNSAALQLWLRRFALGDVASGQEAVVLPHNWYGLPSLGLRFWGQSLEGSLDREEEKILLQ
jgi:hypothetical protein